MKAASAASVPASWRFEAARPGSTTPYDIRPAEIYYLYRWGTGSYHVSGFGQAEYHRAVADYVSEQVGLGRLPVGQITLAPRWKVDYVALVREYLASSSAAALSA